MPEDQIEDQVGLTRPDALAQDTSGETGKQLFSDGGHGQEKEATHRSHHAGASSDAPASSGIPSAMTQHGLRQATEDQQQTPMADLDTKVRQDVEP